MEQIQLVTAPPIEPITLAEAKLQCGFGPIEDSTREASSILSDKLRAYILAARRACEDYTRRAFITQTWMLRLDGFPGSDWRYDWRGYPKLLLPKPPFQSVASFRYIDTFGNLQDLPIDTSYGSTSLQYAYQLQRGDEIQPAWLQSAWARPWPPVRMVPSNVMVQFRCGYGGPLTVSMTANSAVLTGPKFNPDDAPLINPQTNQPMNGELGLAIRIPGAGAGGADLVTNIASVDSNGQATLAATAAATVANVTAWAGAPVPEEIRTAIKMLVEFYYDHGGCEDVPIPRVIQSLLSYYRNDVA